jgi:hypothetical protein
MEDQNQSLHDELCAKVIALLDEGLTTSAIEEQLKKATSDEALIAAVIKKAKKDFFRQRRNEGLTKIAIGAVFIVAGFVITCFNFHANRSVDFAMYGLTSIRLAIIFWGLYKIIG